TSFRQTVSFDVAASSGYAPGVPAVQRIYFQIDTHGGNWSAATGGKAFIGGLAPGMHVLYAFATDAQSAGAINAAPGSSLAPGSIAAYPFFTQPLFYSGNFLGGFIGDSGGHSGTLTISVLSTGAFSGSLNYGGVNYVLRGAFDGAGYFQTTILRGKLPPLL